MKKLIERAIEKKIHNDIKNHIKEHLKEQPEDVLLLKKSFFFTDLRSFYLTFDQVYFEYSFQNASLYYNYFYFFYHIKKISFLVYVFFSIFDFPYDYLFIFFNIIFLVFFKFIFLNISRKKKLFLILKKHPFKFIFSKMKLKKFFCSFSYHYQLCHNDLTLSHRFDRSGNGMMGGRVW